MASPPFRAVGAVKAFSSADGASPVDKPAGTVENDLMALFWITAYGSASESLTPPSGWTPMDNVPSSTGNYGWAIFYRVAGGSEPTTYNVQRNDFAGLADRCFIASWSGPLTSGPIDVTGTETNDPSTATPDLTSLTTLSADTTLVGWCLEWSGANRTISPPAGMTTRNQRTTEPSWEMCDVAVAAAGAVGLKEFSATSANYYTYAFAIASQAAGGGGGSDEVIVVMMG
jgi:hypothetical protein